MNYFSLAAAFFAFHLLLAYLVDHISIHAAYASCSMVSIILVVSYMRIVVGNRFAFLEIAAAQLVYLIGFSYAFFFEGFTGLTVTIGSIITLFVVMQSTARIDWTQRFNLNGKTRAGIEVKPSEQTVGPRSQLAQRLRSVDQMSNPMLYGLSTISVTSAGA